MTKLEIARELAERKDMPLADAIKAVDGVIDIMKDAFKNGRNVYLRGLGSFVIKERKEKTGRNPRTGEVIIIPAHKEVKFNQSQSLIVKQ
ncbi:MAG: integration host factor subunit beta [Prevotellaceae bacterium]|jgi:DNA-binding protein HU-beta|uniref:HU family DNA-binding protein n=1 Tax=Prevotella sp. TaxID=59823 RepID=UPI0020626C4D|nr:integration host factor subunit beta [Prevotellaceae bacterium]DAW06613.1 MAG TPA: DNA binding protein [Caudoviricetes sp.]